MDNSNSFKFGSHLNKDKPSSVLSNSATNTVNARSVPVRQVPHSEIIVPTAQAKLIFNTDDMTSFVAALLPPGCSMQPKTIAHLQRC